jgi:FHA domain
MQEMKIVKTIGRADTNDVVIIKQDISQQHCRISFDGVDRFFVEDLDSTNLTYVNNQPVQQGLFTVNDEVRLSKDTILDLRKIFGLNPLVAAVKNNPKDFTIEFAALKKVFDDYNRRRKKMRLSAKLQRAGLAVAAPLTWVFLPAGTKANLQGDYILMSGLFVAAGTLLIGHEESIKQFESNYHISWACPGCKRHLGSYGWEYWHTIGSHECGAIYSTTKLK